MSDWPQIGEYIENGIRIRVFKPAWASILPNPWGGKKTYDLENNQKQRGFHERSTSELDFD